MTKMVRHSPLKGAMLLTLSIAAGAAGLETGLGATTAQAQTATVRPASAGGMFSPVIIVNGIGITNYEIDQRMKFMALLRQAGDLRKEAEKSLIEDRVRIWQAKRDGITVPAELIKKGEDEFASRANLSGDEFIAELAKGGVDEVTFRDFVTAGIAWRSVVRAHYGQRLNISDADIDRAMMVESARGQGTRVLLSEIIIPAPPEHLDEARQIAEQVSHLHGEMAFADAAGRYSASNTRDQGGRLQWLPLENLPPMLRPSLMALQPGEATAPIELNGAIGVFMLRGMDAGGAAPNAPQTLGYALVSLGAPGSAEGAKLQAQIAADADDCDDLYSLTREQPTRLDREGPVSQAAVPADVGVALAHLDVGETAVLNRGGNQVLVMLCSRQRVAEKAPDAAKPAEDAAKAAGNAPQGQSAESDAAEAQKQQGAQNGQAAQGQQAQSDQAQSAQAKAASAPAAPAKTEQAKTAQDKAAAGAPGGPAFSGPIPGGTGPGTAGTPPPALVDKAADKDAETPERAAIRERLMNERMGHYADNFLAQLVADAVIVRK